MSTLKTHNLQSPDAGSVNIAMAPNAGMVVTGISTFSNKIGVGNVSPNRTLTVTSNGGQIDLHDTDNSTLGIYMNAGNASLYCRGNSTLGNGSMGGVFTVHTHPAGGSIQERLRITSAGLVGINRTSPNHTLEVGGNVFLTSNTSNVNEGSGLLFQAKTGGFNSTSCAAIKGLRTSDTSSYLTFETGGTTERMRITNTGQLLIGTTSGSEILCIKRDDTVGPTITLENNANKAYINNWGSTGGGGSSSGRTNRFEINATLQAQASYCAPFHTFMTGGTENNYEKVRIASSGDVGIGIDSPPCKLAIRDTAEFAAYAGATPNSGNILLQLWNNPPNETANDHASMQFAVNGGTHNRVNTISAVAESASNRKLAFAFCTDEAGTRTEKMRIHGDGYVTKPETPSWVLRPHYSSNQTLSTGTHAIGWNSSDYNTHAKGVRLKNVTLSGSGFNNNIHNGQNVGKITVPVAGIYYVWCTIRMENQNNAGNIYLYVDGSQIVRQHVEDWNDDRYIHGRIQHIVNLNANSYIIWALNCNGGVVSGINDTVNWCGGYLIG